MPPLHDYPERVYAGVLGKIIGVYLGRPFEGWTYERIMAELGEIWYYVHERRDVALRDHILVVTDDDVSGTFTFLRALADHGNSRELTPEQVGQSWLNYIVENRTILWWGGFGNSTEHTAYLRLKGGIPAPRSGSRELNGKIISEQVGAQIFIDGWAMVAPGDPELAADLARRAASVSHDGEAIYGAQVVAAMEAQAFVERDLNTLIDTALRFIPHDAVIARLIHDIRDWHAATPDDWRATRHKIAATYGYDRYGGNCHMVPNHALIIHALLHGDDDFQKSLMIVNTCGWDTDCNAGNVGCLLGIKNGLAGMETGPDWRGPVADRLYLATADGGRAITDAVTETYHIVNAGRGLAGQEPLAPKDGARFHFDLPGAVQGFLPQVVPNGCATLTLDNVEGHSSSGGRSLALRYQRLAPGCRARTATATFIPPEAIAMKGYTLLASPTLYPGQTVRARVEADGSNAVPVSCRLYMSVYGADDAPVNVDGPGAVLAAGDEQTVAWRIPATGGQPIAAIGLELSAAQRADGAVYLDYLTWDGAPEVVLGRPREGGSLWRRAWVDGVDQWEPRWPEPYRLVQNAGTGLVSQGTREWRDYQAAVTLVPQLAQAMGLAVRVQGLRRYYAVMLSSDGTARLVKACDGETVLATAPCDWRLGQSYDLDLHVEGARLLATVNGVPLLEVEDSDCALDGGGVGLIVIEGCVTADAVSVSPITQGRSDQ